MPGGTLKEIAKEWVSQSRWFLRVRYSRFFLKVWLWSRPDSLRQLVLQENYYSAFIDNLLPGVYRAYDIGANEGFVTGALLKRGLAVTALDPDQRNARILAARFSRNRRFRFVAAAAGERPGTGFFYRQRGASALSTLEPKWKQLVETPGHRMFSEYEATADRVTVVTLDQLIAEEGGAIPCMVKIDVEGSERFVLRGLSSQIPLVLFEANLPEFLQETLECVERLVRLDPDAQFNYSSDFRFGLTEFVDSSRFCALLPALMHPCIDVICRMSSYPRFYRV